MRPCANLTCHSVDYRSTLLSWVCQLNEGSGSTAIMLVHPAANYTLLSTAYGPYYEVSSTTGAVQIGPMASVLQVHFVCDLCVTPQHGVRQVSLWPAHSPSPPPMPRTTPPTSTRAPLATSLRHRPYAAIVWAPSTSLLGLPCR